MAMIGPGQGVLVTVTTITINRFVSFLDQELILLLLLLLLFFFFFLLGPKA